MRWALLGAVVALGCQQLPPPADPGLGGGVVPASYAVRSAESGDGPAVLPPSRQPPQKRVAYKPRPAALEPASAGHAADYRWIVGVLAEERGVWVINYAGHGGVDRHGGTLELLDMGPMAGFHAGLLVRVEGEFVDPQPLEIRPAYRVRAMTRVTR